MRHREGERPILKPHHPGCVTRRPTDFDLGPATVPATGRRLHPTTGGGILWSKGETGCAVHSLVGAGGSSQSTPAARASFLVDVFAGGSDGYQGVADEPGLGRSPRHKEF